MTGSARAASIFSKIGNCSEDSRNSYRWQIPRFHLLRGTEYVHPPVIFTFGRSRRQAALRF